MNPYLRFPGLITKATAEAKGPVELQLYVNFPFCTSKCHFCCWTCWISAADLVHSQKLFQDYLSAIRRQIDAYLSPLSDSLTQEGVVIRDIFFGGGTPSVFDAPDLNDILSLLCKYFGRPVHGGSITIEVSPDTVDFEKLSMLRQGGFNRISIGIQSFNDTVLRKVGRKANSRMGIQAVAAARRAGFDNLNLDIIFGLPYESAESWEDTVEKTVDLGPDHISAYRYFAVPGTVGAHLVNQGKCEATTATELHRRYEWARTFFESKGYKEYLHTYFEKGGKRCTSDEAYFSLQRQWIGFGAGANSLFGQRRWISCANARAYIDNPTAGAVISLRGAEVLRRIFSLMLLGKGVDKRMFQKRLGISFEEACTTDDWLRDTVKRLKDKGNMRETKTWLRWLNYAKRGEWMCGLE